MASPMHARFRRPSREPRFFFFELFFYLKVYLLIIDNKMVSTIVKPNDYNLDKLTFAPLANPKKKTLQSILLPSQDNGRSPLIQLPGVDLDMYGIPSKCDFYKEDYQRMFLKLPLNQNIPEIKDVAQGFLKQLDEKLSSNEFKENILGGKKTKYTYQPLVRTPVGEDGEPNSDKHPYLKIKLLTDYPSNAIRTTIVEQTADGRFLKTDTQTLGEFEKVLPPTNKY